MVSTMLLPPSVPARLVWHPVIAGPVPISVRLLTLPGEAATAGNIMLLSLCLPGQPGQSVKRRVRLPLGHSGLCLLNGRQGHEPGGCSVALRPRSAAGLVFECGWGSGRCWYSTRELGLRLLVELLSTRSSTHSSGLWYRRCCRQVLPRLGASRHTMCLLLTGRPDSNSGSNRAMFQGLHLTCTWQRCVAESVQYFSLTLWSPSGRLSP